VAGSPLPGACKRAGPPGRPCCCLPDRSRALDMRASVWRARSSARAARAKFHRAAPCPAPATQVPPVPISARRPAPTRAKPGAQGPRSCCRRTCARRRRRAAARRRTPPGWASPTSPRRPRRAVRGPSLAPPRRGLSVLCRLAANACPGCTGAVASGGGCVYLPECATRISVLLSACSAYACG